MHVVFIRETSLCTVIKLSKLLSAISWETQEHAGTKSMLADCPGAALHMTHALAGGRVWDSLP